MSVSPSGADRRISIGDARIRVLGAALLFSIGGAALLARFGLVTNEHFSPSPQVEVRVTPVIPSVNAETEEEDVPR